MVDEMCYLSGFDFKLPSLRFRECPNNSLLHDSIPPFRLSQLIPIPTKAMRQSFEDMNIRGDSVAISCQLFQ